MEKAHEKGCDFVRSLASVNKVDCDIAISTNGGYPLIKIFIRQSKE